MFIKIWQLIILYIDRMDWRAGHLTTTEGTRGGAFANKNCPQGLAFERFFQMPGVCPGVCPGGMLPAGIDSYISLVWDRLYKITLLGLNRVTVCKLSTSTLFLHPVVSAHDIQLSAANVQIMSVKEIFRCKQFCFQISL